MFEYKFMGKRSVNFTSSNGQNIEGISLYIAHEDPNVIGYATDKVFVPKGIDIPDSLKFGDNLNIIFNHKGKVVSIEKA